MSSKTDVHLSESAITHFRKRVLPILVFAYLMNFIDRTNIGYAYLKMGTATGISAAEYGLGAGLFFVGYVISNVPANILMQRVGARRWLAYVVLGWGIVSALMIAIQGKNSFYCLRFLLGLIEGGFVPGVNFYITCWVPPRFRSRINGIMISAIPIGLIIGGPIAGFIVGFQHPIPGWRALFLIEGAITILLGLAMFRYIPDSADDAHWLKEEEKRGLKAVMAAEIGDSDSKGIGSFWSEFKVFGQYRLLGLLVILLTAYAATFAMIYFMPIILQTKYRLTPLEIGTVAIIPNAISFVSSYLTGRSSEHFGDLRWHLFFICLIGSAGFFTLNLGSSLQWFLVSACAIVAFTIAYFAPLNTAIQNIIGRRAVPLAFVTTIGSIGGFLGPSLMGFVMKTTRGDWSVAASIFGVATIAAAILALLCIRPFRKASLSAPADGLSATKFPRTRP